MKIKSLLIGMLASIALVGCTNEELIETEDIKKPQAELVRGDAYVNFVINTKTDSSRGTVGDNHQNADDNGHHAEAQRKENLVDELLVVIAKVEDKLDESGNAIGKDEYTKEKNGMAKLYGNLAVENTKPNEETRNGYVGVFSYTEDANSEVKKNSAGNYTLANSIRMDYTGHYAVLVVVNPVQKLRTEVLKYIDNYKTAYETVLNYHGTAYTEENNVITSFQMSNKHECIVYTDASNNDPAKPAPAKIEVERTVSKATWRWAEPLEDKNLPNILKNKPNVYSVNVNVTNSEVEMASFWYKDVKNPGATNQYDAYLYSEVFHKAKDAEGQIWWVLFKKNYEGDKFTTGGGQVKFDAIEAIFKGQDKYELYNGVTDVDNDDTESSTGTEVKDDVFGETYAQATAETRLTEEFVRSLTFVYTKGNAPADRYYVHLTHYALTNLTPSVYAVRHIADLNFKNERQFGFLGINEFLVTPYSSTINAGSIPSFTNKLADVIAKADAYKFVPNTTLDFFKELPKEGNDGTASSTHYTGEESNNVGALMEYIYENSALSTIQNAGNVTGVVLAGQIYDKNGLVEVLYKYNQEYFRTLQALVDKYGTNGVLKTTDGKVITPNSTDEEAEAAAGLDVYASGRCFYYSTDIKHLEDNDDATIGTMELAIMRNNIYSLAVKSISDIGDARISVEENDPLTDIRSYIQLEVSIKPWIVRFNDLNL